MNTKSEQLAKKHTAEQLKEMAVNASRNIEASKNNLQRHHAQKRYHDIQTALDILATKTPV